MLKKKVLNKKAIIGIFGLGYIGLPRSIQFAKKGFQVIGFDIDKKKIELIKKGKSYISTVRSSEIKEVLKLGFNVTDEFSKTSLLDVIIFCLPTPLKRNNIPDLSYITNTFNNISPYLKKNQAMCLESTTYPGTSEEVLEPRLKKKGYILGKNYFLIYSPERDDPGRKNMNNSLVPRIYGTKTLQCKEIGQALYNSIFKKLVYMKNIKSAEMTKLYENIFRSINIGLVNEMKKICHKMNLNIFDIIEAAGTKPYGFYKFYPGPGLGGHCIPIDPFYLSWKAKQFNINTDFIKLAGYINKSMPKWIVNKLVNHYKNNKKRIKDKKILILGVAYKKNINDTRESPAFEIIKQLISKKAKVCYCDPYVKEISGLRNYNFKMKSVKIDYKHLKNFDAIIIVTDHDRFNYDAIRKNSKIIIDTRGVYKKEYTNIIPA